MARPTKEEIAKRIEIEKCFRRDAPFYIEFEEEGNKTENEYGHDCFVGYPFASHCEWRDENFQGIIDHIGKNYNLGLERESGLFGPYYCENYLVEKVRQIGFKLDDQALIEKQNDYYDLSSAEKEQLKKEWEEANHFSGHDTHNLPIFIPDYQSFMNHLPRKSALVQIDFTKPLEEIIAIVSTLKNRFDKNHSIIQSLDEYLGISPIREPYKCDITQCDIYKHKSPKPLAGRLADVLFIYDCNRLRLTQEYVMHEIDRYWNEVKNIHREKISKNTYTEYLKFAKDQIDGRGYEHFLTGVKE
ncbi:hypothetical protein [Sulfuricurvum sp.]|uniref:hypothetical protein n=1 Tax=Sulfuricurvum sp. TaxID=2025608 RepID=UPI0035647B1C